MAEQCRRDIRNPWARGSLAGVSAAILAGGLGTRLRPVVADRPKVLAEVGGRPFVAYLLDQLSQAGIDSAILCTGYLGEQVEATFGARYGSLRLTYSRERSPRGTAGALRLALPLFESPSVLVLNGDSYCEADLPAFWSWHGAREAKATILLRHMPDTARYGRVAVDADGRVLGFSEKGAQAGPGWINAGAYLLARRLISTIPAAGAVSLEREMFPAWIGHGLYGCRGDGVVLDIGTPEAYTGASAWRPGSR
ncbi:MAG TPA: nucleotidyltransferase family protein [Candidatus Methylomirabilis sp.]|nr:nucleotidyltransferase family protein [Candidatus Methylomirabilis sp.]